MSLFIEQANLCLPTTKTTEMIEISIIFIILRIASTGAEVTKWRTGV